MEVRRFLEKLRSGDIATNSYVSDDSWFNPEGAAIYPYGISEHALWFYKETEYRFRRLFAFVDEKRYSSREAQEINNSVFEFIRLKAHQAVNPLQRWASLNGLVHYSTLNRMVLLKRGGGDAGCSGQVECPISKGDLIEVRTLLEKNFNIFAERIPGIEDLGTLMSSTYLIREKGRIIALLISEKKGITEELRFWFVEEEYRDRGYGGILMRCFLNKNVASKRFILWVESANISAIKKYRYLGFTDDKIVNEVYLTKDLL